MASVLSDTMLSWEDVQRACAIIIEKLEDDNYTPKTILAIGKGGIIPAALIHQRWPKADFEVCMVTSYKGRQQHQVHIGHKIDDLDDDSTLVIDDIYDTGATYAALTKEIPDARFFTVVAKGSPQVGFGRIVPQDSWVVFPWEPESEDEEED